MLFKNFIPLLLFSVFFNKSFAQLKKADSLLVTKKSEKCLKYYEEGALDSAKIELKSFVKFSTQLTKSYPTNQFLISQKIDAMDYLSSILFEEGNLLDALSYADTVLKYFESTKDSFNIALSLNNIAYMYQSQTMYDKAISNYRQAHTILFKNNTEESKIYTATVYNNMGLIYEHQRHFDSTLYYYKKSLEIRKQINDRRGISESLNNIGNVYQKQRKLTEALPYLTEALQIKREIKDVNGISYTLNNLAIICRLSGDNKKAMLYAEESKTWAEKTNNIEAISQVYKNLSKINYALANNKEAYNYLEKYIIYNDSLINTNNKKALYKHQVRYEFEKKEALLKVEQEKKDAISAEQIRRQKIVIYSSIIGSILLLFIVVIVFRSYKQKKKSNIELTDKNIEITNQKHLIEEKSKEILDSINYAKRIQTAILPPKRMVSEFLPNSFILYKPKDIVAGDFYWMQIVNENNQVNKILFAAADCTGHGVPGAMVSVICNSGLNRSVREFEISEPGKILDKTRDLVIQEFEKSDEEVKDGMDISLCSLELSDNNIQLEWSGANNPLWYIRNDAPTELIEVKADKQPIGKYGEAKPFTTHTIQLQKNDTLYIFTDGYQDQFGGEKGKKFKAAKLKELLISIQSENMENQKQILDKAFEDWKAKTEQVDDVCIIGVRV